MEMWSTLAITFDTLCHWETAMSKKTGSAKSPPKKSFGTKTTYAENCKTNIPIGGKK